MGVFYFSFLFLLLLLFPERSIGFPTAASFPDIILPPFTSSKDVMDVHDSIATTDYHDHGRLPHMVVKQGIGEMAAWIGGK